MIEIRHFCRGGLGGTHAVAGGIMAEGLAQYRPEQLAELARGLALIVIGHSEAEAPGGPAADWLVETATTMVEFAEVGCEIAIVGDAISLAVDLFPERVLQRRRALHRMMEWLPESPYLLVEVDGRLSAHWAQVIARVDALLTERPNWSVVIFVSDSAAREVDHDSGLGKYILGEVRVLPQDLSIEDLASVIEGSEAVVAVSSAMTTISKSFGRRVVTIDSASADEPEFSVGRTDEGAGVHALSKPVRGQLELDPPAADLIGHFDQLARTIERAMWRQKGSSTTNVAPAVDLLALRRAYIVRGDRLRALQNALVATQEESSHFQAELYVSRAESDQLKQNLLAVQIRASTGDERYKTTTAELAALATRYDAAIKATDLAVSTSLAAEDVAASLAHQLQRTEANLAALHSTKVMRFLRFPRAVYAWVRQI
jgi:hypothetical protein